MNFTPELGIAGAPSHRASPSVYADCASNFGLSEIKDDKRGDFFGRGS